MAQHPNVPRRVPIIPSAEDRVGELVKWGIGLAGAMLVLTLIFWAIMPYGFVLGLLLTGGVAYIVWRVVKMGLFIVGQEDPTPRGALLLRFGRVVGVAVSGLYFKWPWDKVVRYKKTQFSLTFHIPDVYSKQVIDDNGRVLFATQRIPVDLALAFSWADPNKLYDIPVEGLVWGSDLLARTYESLPFSLDTVTPEQLGNLLVGPLARALTHAMADFTHLEMREENQKIKKKIIYFLYAEPGDVFRKLGIPPAELDLGTTGLQLPRDTQDEMRAVEIALHQARARTETAQGAARAAEFEAEAIEKLIRPLQEAGFPPAYIALILRGAQGQPLDFGQLRDILIMESLAGGTEQRLSQMLTRLSLGEINQLVRYSQGRRRRPSP